MKERIKREKAKTFFRRRRKKRRPNVLCIATKDNMTVKQEIPPDLVRKSPLLLSLTALADAIEKDVEKLLAS